MSQEILDLGFVDGHTLLLSEVHGFVLVAVTVLNFVVFFLRDLGKLSLNNVVNLGTQDLSIL